MKLSVLCSLALLAVSAPFAHSQSSPFSLNVFPAQIFTASGQSGTPIQLNGLSSSTSTVGSSYTSGTITVTGTSLTTMTFSLMGSADNGATFYALPLYSVASPATSPATTITVTANGLYQVNLAGLTHVKFVTSGTFTATNVSLTLTATPNGTVARGPGGGGSMTPATDSAIGAVQLASGQTATTLSKVATTGAAGDLTGLAAQVATMNAATAAALGGTPTLCGSGLAAQGIDPNGNASGCFTPTSGAGGTNEQVQVNNGGALGGVSGFTYDPTNGLRIPNVLIANQPQNMWSTTAYNTGGNTGGANGIATILANSTYLAQPSSAIFLEPTYTEYDQSAMDAADPLALRRSFFDLRQGGLHFKSVNPGPHAGANTNVDFDCSNAVGAGSTYGGSGAAELQNCFLINYTSSIPGYYYGTIVPDFAYTEQLFNINYTSFSASINKSLFTTAAFAFGAGDTQWNNQTYFNGYGGGDHGSDEGVHIERLTSTVGGEMTGTIGTNTDAPSSGYKQLWLSARHGGIGVGNWLMDSTTTTTDSVASTSAGDGGGSITLVMTGNSYPVSTFTTLAGNIRPPTGNISQTKTSETFTVNTTTDLSVSNPVTPTKPTLQFEENGAECAVVQSYGTYNSGAHTQTVTALLSDPHNSGVPVYIGGMACRGLTTDADVTNGVTSLFYVFGSSASNKLLVGRSEQGSIASSFTPVAGSAVHLYQVARVLDVNPTPGNPPTAIGDFLKVEETGTNFAVNDSVEAGLIATQEIEPYLESYSDFAPYAQGVSHHYILNGAIYGGVAARDFFEYENSNTDSAYTYDGGRWTMGSFTHFVGPVGTIFSFANHSGSGQVLAGDFFQDFACGFKLFNQGAAFINSTCSGASSQIGYDLQGDIQLKSAANGQIVASFTDGSTGIQFTRTATMQGNTAAPTLTLNVPTGIGATDTFKVNGQSTLDDLFVTTGHALHGNVVSNSVNLPSVLNCTLVTDSLGNVKCNTGTITAATLEANQFNLNNGTPGQDVGFFSGSSNTVGFEAVNNGIGDGNLHITADAAVYIRGIATGTVFVDGNVSGAYSPGGPGVGLYIHSSANTFGTNSSNAGSLNLLVADTGAASFQYVLTANDNPTSGAKSALTLNPNGGVTKVTAMLQLPTYTVSTLPTCATVIANSLAVVSDATSPTYGGALTGGGTVHTPVFCDGSAWSAH